MQAKHEALLRAVRECIPAIQNEAPELDRIAQFPHGSFDRLAALGLLTASLPEHLGGLGFGYGEPGAAAMLDLFEILGEASLAVARLYEAHVNALQLIVRYGAAALAAACARDAAEKHLFALWVTDSTSFPVGLQPGRSGLMLRGRKDFCSGAGIATRALITAADETGARMLMVRLAPGAQAIESHVRLGGMRAAVTGSYDFTGMQVDPGDLVGQAGDYLKEPVFSAGAWRGSAAALGGLKALLELHRGGIVQRQRQNDPHQQARFGESLIAYETSRLWMEKAARIACVEDDTPEAIVAYVNLARIAVESACLDAMRHVQRSLGLSSFIAGSHAELLYRDLAIYLRQPAPDETLTKAAAFYFSTQLQRR